MLYNCVCRRCLCLAMVVMEDRWDWQIPLIEWGWLTPPATLTPPPGQGRMPTNAGRPCTTPCTSVYTR